MISRMHTRVAHLPTSGIQQSPSQAAPHKESEDVQPHAHGHELAKPSSPGLIPQRLYPEHKIHIEFIKHGMKK